MPYRDVLEHHSSSKDLSPSSPHTSPLLNSLFPFLLLTAYDTIAGAGAKGWVIVGELGAGVVGAGGGRGMTESVVAGWLGELGLGNLIEVFEEEGIDSEALAALNEAQLKQLGVTRMGDRTKVRNEAGWRWRRAIGEERWG
eukprot:768536-Hanusia_phi.AAC.9